MVCGLKGWSIFSQMETSMTKHHNSIVYVYRRLIDFLWVKASPFEFTEGNTKPLALSWAGETVEAEVDGAR